MKLQRYEIGQLVRSTCETYRPGQTGKIVEYLGTRGPSNTMHWYGVSFVDPAGFRGRVTADLAHCELEPADPGDLDHLVPAEPLTPSEQAYEAAGRG